MSIEDPTMVRHFDGNCTVETMMNYSEICLDPDHADFAIKACNHFGSALSHVAVVICVLNGVMGCCGNLLTLIAIPYSIYNNHEENRRNVLQREYNMTCTLFLICLCYLVFVAPIAIVNIIDPTAQNPQLHLAFFCVYWFQYSLNFLIYAARCEQYRRAYFFFLGKIIPFWSQKNSNSTVFVLNKEKHVVTSRPRGCDHPSSSKDNIQGPRQILGESVFSSKSTSFVVMGKKRRREIIYEKTEDEVRTTSIHPDSIQEEIILKVHARWRKRSKSCIM
ncbi:hypothetical protein TCAL_14708 [Tigriopus californicus]|uniref:G-protein coupled receptors family 1 profile domain-containing protein n=1 Tax=Tigriopus californicus TaxID=6832 RepID=A0A553PGX5_TIGCA|nr:hypothetical protein TCAL_14708 [Tigriopus californicus]